MVRRKQLNLYKQGSLTILRTFMRQWKNLMSKDLHQRPQQVRMLPRVGSLHRKNWKSSFLAAKQKDLNQEDIISRNTSKYPQSLCNSSGDPFHTNKAKFLHFLENQVPDALVKDTPQGGTRCNGATSSDCRSCSINLWWSLHLCIASFDEAGSPFQIISSWLCCRQI